MGEHKGRGSVNEVAAASYYLETLSSVVGLGC